MIKIKKETKIKLLKAVKTGVFDGEQFPELQTELSNITIEIIDKTEQVDRDVSYLLND